MRHSRPSALRAACAALLLLSAAACAPAGDPAKSCASPTTFEGLKSVLLSAAASGVDGAAGKGWASLPGVRLALELPRLAGFDKTTKKASCEGRLVMTSPGPAGGAPQSTSEDISYTVQPSAREGEIIYGVVAAPITIAALHTALATPPKAPEQLGLTTTSVNVGTADKPLVVTDDVFDITAHPTVYRAYLAALPPELRSEDWARKFNGTGADFKRVTVGGQPMLYGTMCEPGNCGNDGVTVLLTLDQQHVYGERFGNGEWSGAKADETKRVLLNGTPEGLSDCLDALTDPSGDADQACASARF